MLMTIHKSREKADNLSLNRKLSRSLCSAIKKYLNVCRLPPACVDQLIANIVDILVKRAIMEISLVAICYRSSIERQMPLSHRRLFTQNSIEDFSPNSHHLHQD